MQCHSTTPCRWGRKRQTSLACLCYAASAAVQSSPLPAYILLSHRQSCTSVCRYHLTTCRQQHRQGPTLDLKTPKPRLACMVHRENKRCRVACWLVAILQTAQHDNISELSSCPNTVTTGPYGSTTHKHTEKSVLLAQFLYIQRRVRRCVRPLLGRQTASRHVIIQTTSTYCHSRTQLQPYYATALEMQVNNDSSCRCLMLQPPTVW